MVQTNNGSKLDDGFGLMVHMVIKWRTVSVSLWGYTQHDSGAGGLGAGWGVEWWCEWAWWW